ncbi:MAG: hypothetical protein ABEJ35_07880 [Halobacteriaceae archaeon]
MQGEVHYWYETSDNGTVVRVTAEFGVPESRFERAIQPVVTRYLNREFRNSLRTMKALIEAEQATDSPRRDPAPA